MQCQASFLPNLIALIFYFFKIKLLPKLTAFKVVLCFLILNFLPVAQIRLQCFSLLKDSLVETYIKRVLFEREKRTRKRKGERKRKERNECVLHVFHKYWSSVIKIEKGRSREEFTLFS